MLMDRKEKDVKWGKGWCELSVVEMKKIKKIRVKQKQKQKQKEKQREEEGQMPTELEEKKQRLCCLYMCHLCHSLYLCH